MDPTVKTKNFSQTGQPTGRFFGSAEFFNRYYQVIILILVVVFFVWSGLYLYDFYTTRVDIINKNLIIKKAELTRKQQDLENVKQLRVDYQQLEVDAQSLFNALPDQSDLPSIYLQLNAIVAQSGLSLQSINLSEPNLSSAETNQQSIREIDITMNINGNDYQAVKAMLTSVESSLRLLDVTSINYDPRNEQFSVILKTYYKLEG